MERQRRACRFTLRHVGLGGRSGVVSEVEAVEGASREELAREIYDQAAGDVSTIGGVQKYVVLAYGDEGRSCGRYAMRLRGDDDLDVDGAEPSEPPTSEGFLSQTMRHKEAMFRLSTQATAALIQDLRGENRQLRERIETLEKRHDEVMQLREKLRGEDADRTVQHQIVTAQLAREETILGKVMLLAPIVVNKLAGKNVLPAPEASEVALASFMESLSKEQMETFVGTLKPEQQAVIFSMYEKARTLLDKQSAASAQPTAGANGAIGAGG